MRSLLTLILWIPTLAFCQGNDGPINANASEWNSSTYTQEDKIYSRSVWTFVDNPALAGFDRKLAFAYRYQMKNLKMGVPNNKGNLVLAFQQHEAFVDLPFGGPKQNWGLGLYYNNEKELQVNYHRVQMARSLRIRLVKEHHLILGIAVGVQFSKLEDWEGLTFPDMIDPRSGFIYQTNEVRPIQRRVFPFYNIGLRYYWKRLSIDYAVRFEQDNALALTGAPVPLMSNKLKVAYHIFTGEDVTITPEAVFAANSTFYREQTSPTSSAQHVGNSFYLFSGYVTIAYKDMAFGQLGVLEHNKLRFRLGYQLKDMLVIQASFSSYLDKTMEKIGGIALVDASIRYQIKAWNR